MEGDFIDTDLVAILTLFQSTPSAWRETAQRFRAVVVLCISIHSLRMEGDFLLCLVLSAQLYISIHSLRMEGDTRLPESDIIGKISIHSLRMEGDPESFEGIALEPSFQSTPSAWRETTFAMVNLQ